MKRLLDQCCRQTETLYHVLQHMVRCEPEPTVPDLQGHMSIAEVVAAASEQMHVRCSRLDDLFRPWNDFDHIAFLVGEALASSQHCATLGE